MRKTCHYSFQSPQEATILHPIKLSLSFSSHHFLKENILDLRNDQLTAKVDFAEELLVVVETLDGEKCRYQRYITKIMHIIILFY